VFDRTGYLNEPLPVEKELKILFPENKPLLIIEAGACEGEDSIRYARLFPSSQIYAFEPLPGNIEIAKENFKKYNIQNITLIEKALSDKNGSAQFFVSGGNPPGTTGEDWDYGNKSSSLLYPTRHTEILEFIKFDQTIIVGTITLDGFCKENKIAGIDFIHMDVQGAEAMVLKGAVNSLLFTKAIWLEVSTIDLYKDQALAEEIEVFMYSNGFIMIKDCLYGISGDRLYISKAFYPKHRRLFPGWTRRRSFLRKVLRKAGF
jgi:FkbM family methyltransferase